MTLIPDNAGTLQRHFANLLIPAACLLADICSKQRKATKEPRLIESETFSVSPNVVRKMQTSYPNINLEHGFKQYNISFVSGDDFGRAEVDCIALQETRKK
jgi:hypothetical protein